MGRLNVLSVEKTQFEDRDEAGRMLARELSRLRGENPLFLGIPRGGMIIAGVAANLLDAEMDALFVLRIPMPGNPELAVGAVAEGGVIVLDESFVARMGLEKEIAGERRKCFAELERRAALVRARLGRVPLEGRTVVIIDDGVATGATTRAAFRAARRENPRRLIGAFPVGLDGAVEKLAEEADELICLRCPPDFLAVSQFYRHFPQAGDDEILRLFRPAEGPYQFRDQ